MWRRASSLVLLVGVACGLPMARRWSWRRVPPIVATLALGSIYSGLALLLRPTPGGDIDDALSDALTYDVHGVPTSLILIVVGARSCVPAAPRRTRFGMSLYAHRLVARGRHDDRHPRAGS